MSGENKTLGGYGMVDIDDIILPKKLTRRINPERVDALAESMKRIGQKHAVTISEDMVLIAGNHRIAAARAIGWKQIRADVVPTDDIVNELIAIDENLIREELTALEKSEHLKRRNALLVALGERALPGNPGENRSQVEVEVKGKGKKKTVSVVKDNTKKTTGDMAHDVGISERALQSLLQVANSIDAEVKEIIANHEVANNMSELTRLARLPPTEQKKLAEQLIGGKIKTIKEGTVAVAREKQREEFRKLSEETKKLPDTIILANADFFEYESGIKDGSVDMVLTDIPYVDEWKENIVPFMTVVNRVLKPGGAMVMVVGHVRLPEVFEGFRQCDITYKEDALSYYHMCALAHEGHLAAMHHVGAMNGYKPIVIGMKGKHHKPFKMYNDLVKGSGREKDAHDWQQSAEEVLPLVDAFSKPGDVILDPCMGSGTYGIVAKMTVRKFIGIEINKDTYEDAHRRIVTATS